MTERSGPAEPEIAPDRLRDHYRGMLLIRRFEERAGQLFGMGLIGGFCHLCIGQEAVVVGLESVAEPGDSRITAYRSHGHMLACGMDPGRIMAELAGRAGGWSGGKGGSMHMASPEHGFYGGHGIVGASVPIGVGLAFAARYRGTDRVSFTYFGDGAAAQGQVHESFVMAAEWRLPVVFVIENNRTDPGPPPRRGAAPPPPLCDRGAPFGIPGRAVDGMDVLAVREAGATALRHCRAGRGPYLLEMRTQRYRGHSMADPSKYRARQDTARLREDLDCIGRLRALMLARGVIDEAGLKAIDRDIREVVNAAADLARQDAEPSAEALWTDLHAQRAEA